MKRFLTGVCFLGAVSPLYATLDFYDSFNYSTVNVQLSTAASPTWVAYTGGGANPTNISGSLSYPGLQTASGDNSVQFNGSTATGVAARNLSQLYNAGNISTIYYSLTFKVNTITAADWGGSGNFITGSFMMGFNQKLQNGSALAQADAAGPLLIRTGDPNNVSGTANDFQQYQLGVGVTAISPSSRIFDSTHNYNPGDTLFLVVSYTFGGGSSNDVAKLYVNPVPGSLEGANTPVITAAGVTNVINGQVQSFFLRNNSVEPSATQIDDLRVGTTWADVTPAVVPEPTAGIILGAGTIGLLLARRRRV